MHRIPAFLLAASLVGGCSSSSSKPDEASVQQAIDAALNAGTVSVMRTDDRRIFPGDQLRNVLRVESVHLDGILVEGKRATVKGTAVFKYTGQSIPDPNIRGYIKSCSARFKLGGQFNGGGLYTSALPAPPEFACVSGSTSSIAFNLLFLHFDTGWRLAE